MDSLASVPAEPGKVFLMPLLTLTLKSQSGEMEVSGLVDSGSTVNVLPFTVGVQLGERWKPESANLKLVGVLARYPAMPIILEAKVGSLPPVKMIFAWTQADDVPLILGPINFFDEFDVCFHRSRKEFEVRPKA